MLKKFVLNYIRTNMGHGLKGIREEILLAIADGFISEFYEDTIMANRFYAKEQLDKCFDIRQIELLHRIEQARMNREFQILLLEKTLS